MPRPPAKAQHLADALAGKIEDGAYPVGSRVTAQIPNATSTQLPEPVIGEQQPEPDRDGPTTTTRRLRPHTRGQQSGMGWHGGGWHPTPTHPGGPLVAEQAMRQVTSAGVLAKTIE